MQRDPHAIKRLIEQIAQRPLARIERVRIHATALECGEYRSRRCSSEISRSLESPPNSTATRPKSRGSLHALREAPLSCCSRISPGAPRMRTSVCKLHAVLPLNRVLHVPDQPLQVGRGGTDRD